MISMLIRVTIFWSLSILYVDGAQELFGKSDDWDRIVWNIIYWTGIVVLAPWLFEKLFD